MTIKDLNLEQSAVGHANLSPCMTHKVMSIFQVAAYSELTSAITLGRPFAPVEGVNGPRRKVIARSWLGIVGVVGHGSSSAIGHARIGAGTNIS